MLTKFIQKAFQYTALVFTISLYACSSDDKPGNNSENDIQTGKQTKHSFSMPADACALLTEKEAKAILGGCRYKRDEYKYFVSIPFCVR